MLARQHEVRLPGAPDGLGHLRVGGMHQVADLAADGLLPAGQGIDVGVNAGSAVYVITAKVIVAALPQRRRCPGT